MDSIPDGYYHDCRKLIYRDIIRLTEEGKLSSTGAKALLRDLLDKMYKGELVPLKDELLVL